MPPNPAAPKPLKHQPKQSARRSKEEREGIERVESERRQARAHAAAADEAVEASRKRQKYGIQAPRKEWQDRGKASAWTVRTGRGGRGGFMGSSQASKRTSTEGADRSGAGGGGGGGESGGGRGGRGDARPGRSSRAGASSSARRTAASKVAVKSEPDEHAPGYPSQKDIVKKEDPEYIYISDGDDGIGGGRDVDAILISSDTEEGDTSGSPGEGDGEKPRKVGIHRKQRLGFAPHRIQRNEHRDRIIGINTESSASTASAAERMDEHGHDTLPKRNKGKSRMTIKPDPETDEMEGVEGPGAEAETVEVSDEEEPEAGDLTTAGAGEAEEEESKAAVVAKLRKSRVRRLAHLTNEEEAERLRQEQSLRDVQQEFSRVSVGNRSKTGIDTANEDVDSPHDQDATELDNVAYVFQFPPIIPDLYVPTVKGKPDAPSGGALGESSTSGSTAKGKKGKGSNTADNPVKVEDGAPGMLPSAGHARKPHLQPGHVGKFRVHKSGKISLSWGGTSLQAAGGTNPWFLQTVMLMKVDGLDDKRDENGDVEQDEDAKRREELGYKGAATSFGQVRGKFVVTPDWEEILG